MKFHKVISIIGLILAAVLLLSAGFALGRNAGQNNAETAVPETTAPADENAGSLGITVTKVSNNERITFSAEETGKNFNQSLTYSGVTDVNIDINGTVKKLEDALKDGDITGEEIFCRARQDARCGNCEETMESIHGVSHFTYHYPDFDLRLIYDVLEAPDGEQYLISDMLIYRSSDSFNISPDTNFIDPETGKRLNNEDWGLNFALTEPTGNGITVTCTQSGGQQIGQLEVFAYSIYVNNGEQLGDGNAQDYETEIAMDGSCQFTIDWSESYGTLASGEYRLQLWVRDLYDESQLHPLMDNFQDWQLFSMDFVIP